LTGTEIRGCWEAWPAGDALPAATLTIGPARPASEPHPREFVEVDAAATVGDADLASPDPAPADLAPAAAPPAGEPGWSLWGDLDR
jgi:hypothetical protein